MITVGDLLVEFKERPAKGDEPTVLTLTERNGFVRQSDRFNKRLATDDVSNYKVVRLNDVAFNPYLLWAGAVAQNTIVDEGIISPLYPTFRVREGHDPRFVARLLLTPQLIGAYDGIAFGSVPRRRRSSVADFLNLPLERVPPLAEQRRIAAILDHVDALLANRRRVLAELDLLTHSIFHDMFAGDRDPTYELGEVASFFGGASLPSGEPFVGQPAGTLLMKVSDMNTAGNEEGIVSTALWSPYDGSRSATVGSGAVVLPKRGASIATNKKRLATRRTSLDPNLMGIQPRPEWITSAYLFHWFRTFDLTGITSGSTVPQLNKQDLAPLLIPVPSLVRQAEFERRLSSVAPIRIKAEMAHAKDQELFTCLQARAFRGDL